MNYFKILILFLLFTVISCAPEEKDISRLDTSGYEQLDIKYISPGEIRSFKASSGDILSVSMSSAKSSKNYDFEMSENRPWDRRIRNLGYKNGRLYLLSIKRYEEDGGDITIDFEQQLTEGCINRIPVLFDGNKESFNQQITIKKDCGDNYVRSDTLITISGSNSDGKTYITMTSTNDEAYYSSSYEADMSGVILIIENEVTAEYLSTDSILNN